MLLWREAKNTTLKLDPNTCCTLETPYLSDEFNPFSPCVVLFWPIYLSSKLLRMIYFYVVNATLIYLELWTTYEPDDCTRFAMLFSDLMYPFGSRFSLVFFTLFFLTLQSITFLQEFIIFYPVTERIEICAINLKNIKNIHLIYLTNFVYYHIY